MTSRSGRGQNNLNNMADTNLKSEFIKKIDSFRKEKVDFLTLEVLKEMLIKDLPYMDCFYIDQRARQLVDQSLEKVDFHDEEISQLRRKLLEKTIAKAAKNIPKPKKSDGKTPTDFRNDRCEDSAQLLAKLIIERNLLFSDDYYLSVAFDEDSKLLFTLLVKGWMDSVSNGVEMSINQSILKAQQKLWGCDKETITMKQLDKVLKLK